MHLLNTLFLLWQRFSWRYWKHNPGKSSILLFIFALGISTYLAIGMANRAAVTSFSGFTEAVAGQSDWIIQSPSGYLSENVLFEVRSTLDTTPAHIIPVLETTATPPPAPNDPDYGRRSFQLVGLDLIQLQNLPQGSNTLRNVEGLESMASLWETPHAIFISDTLAQELSLDPQDTLTVLIQDTRVALTIQGIIPATGRSIAMPRNMLLIDLPQLQTLTGHTHKLSRIEILIPGQHISEKRIAAVGDVLKAAAHSQPWTVQSQAQSRQSTQTMTKAFRMNLNVLALIALLVALYLIAQALDASVVRRRKEIATLRSLGVSQKMILLAWFFEVLVFGIIGSAFGILLAWGLSQFFVQAVAQTVNALYQASEAHSTQLHSSDIIVGFSIGIVASIIAGLVPANDAASTPPAQILKTQNETPGLALFNRPWLGCLLIIAGIALSLAPPLELAGGTRFPVAGFGAAFLWIIGGTLIVGALFTPIAKIMKALGGDHVSWQLARARLQKATSRHKLAVSGLFIAIAMAAGMNILISSFAKTMDVWIHTRFKADLYLSSEAGQSASSLNRVSSETWRSIIAMPEIKTADVFQTFLITLNDRATFISGANVELLTRDGYLPWVKTPQANWWKLIPDQPTPALINETFSERFSIQPGTVIEVPTFQGTQSVKVTGIYADYGNERGSLLIDKTILSQWFNNDSATNLSLFLKPGHEPDAVLAKIQSQHPDLSIRTNRSLRASIIQIFNQTFAITHAVKWIGIFVALVGLVLSLISLIWESQTQLKIMRQLGIKHSTIVHTLSWEGLGITLTGVIGGLLLSLPLGYLLIFVINKQSFGWTLQFHIPWVALLTLAGIVIALGYGVSRLTTQRLIRSKN